MVNKSCKTIPKLARCYGKLYSPNAKECTLCKYASSCKELSPPESHSKSKIRDAIREAISTRPMSIDEIQALISAIVVKCKGTSVFYHLTYFKKQGVLDVRNIDGVRKYSIFKRENHGIPNSEKTV